jgi:sulfate adenylyltransferase
MSDLVAPHGRGELKPLLLTGQALEKEKSYAQTLPRLKVSSREAGDIILMGIGGLTALEGFMTYVDWKGDCDDYCLSNGLFWPIPITLSATRKETYRLGSDISVK